MWVQMGELGINLLLNTYYVLGTAMFEPINFQSFPKA